MCVGAPHYWSNCDTEACGQWDAEMHDLVNLLPGSSLDPVWFLVLQREKAKSFNRYYTENNISIKVIIAWPDN